MKKLACAFVGSALLAASQAQAAVFPVDTASTTLITDLKTDLVAWAVAFMGVVLTIYAYRKVKSIAR